MLPFHAESISHRLRLSHYIVLREIQWRIQGEGLGALNPPLEPQNNVEIPCHNLYVYIIDLTLSFFFTCAPYISDKGTTPL